ncbi:hypothetical protein C4F49_03930 [Sphingobacterium sp. KB22]|uniref:Uncharacterized protein n=1 Tax=Sphingobacterium hungaricum TaxID=2082723 RepID=A0A928YP78_9SPHI|nr:hypothetical protein [Sphingobacterium hungaricum]
MRLYYRIWVDAIVKLRSRPENVGMWKFFAMAFMSMSMAINFMFIETIIGRYIIQRSFTV